MLSDLASKAKQPGAKLLLLVAVAVTALVSGSVVGAISAPTKAPTASKADATAFTVEVGDNGVDKAWFKPDKLTIHQGDTVTWTWEGKMPHNVCFGSDCSPDRTGSGTYSKAFSTTGTFNYFCLYHKGAPWYQIGTITVLPADSTSTSTSTNTTTESTGANSSPPAVQDPTVKIASHIIKVSRSGVTKLKVSCKGPATSTCKGRLLLNSVASRKRKHAQAARKKKARSHKKKHSTKMDMKNISGSH